MPDPLGIGTDFRFGDARGDVLPWSDTPSTWHRAGGADRPRFDQGDQREVYAFPTVSLHRARASVPGEAGPPPPGARPAANADAASAAALRALGGRTIVDPEFDEPAQVDVDGAGGDEEDEPVPLHSVEPHVQQPPPGASGA